MCRTDGSSSTTLASDDDCIFDVKRDYCLTNDEHSYTRVIMLCVSLRWFSIGRSCQPGNNWFELTRPRRLQNWPLVFNAAPVNKWTSHPCDPHKNASFSRVYVSISCPIILWLSKTADQGYYRFGGDKYEMNFRCPSTGHSFTALRNEKLFYILNLQSANQQSASGKEPSACNFMQQVHLDSRLHFSRANRLSVPKPFVNFTLYWGTLPTIRLCTRWIINVLLTISTSVKTLQCACNSWDL